MLTRKTPPNTLLNCSMGNMDVVVMKMSLTEFHAVMK